MEQYIKSTYFIDTSKEEYYRFENVPHNCEYLEIVDNQNAATHRRGLFIKRQESFFFFTLNTPNLKVLDFSKSKGLLHLNLCSLVGKAPKLEVLVLPPCLEDIDGLSFPNLRIIRGGKVKKYGPISCPLLETIDFSNVTENILILSAKLDHIELPESVSTFSFQNLDSLKSVKLPNNIEELPSNAFNGCYNLEVIFGGSRIKSLGYGALLGCTKLASLPFIIKDIKQEDIFPTALPKIRVGIILKDSDYIVIWSLTDYKYYFLLNQKTELYKNGKFVKVSNSYSCNVHDVVSFEECPNIKFEGSLDGIKIIRGNRFFAKNITVIDSVEEIPDITSPFNHSCEKNKAIKKYIQIRKDKKLPISVIINRHISTVQSLDIDDIIDSYRTRIRVVDKRGIPRCDDYVLVNVTRKSKYSDPYIDSLLPPYETDFEQDDLLTDKQYEEYELSDILARENARAKYNQEEHIEYLNECYMSNLLSDATYVETHLHLEMAEFHLNNFYRWEFRSFDAVNSYMKLNERNLM